MPVNDISRFPCPGGPIDGKRETSRKDRRLPWTDLASPPNPSVALIYFVNSLELLILLLMAGCRNVSAAHLLRELYDPHKTQIVSLGNGRDRS